MRMTSKLKMHWLVSARVPHIHFDHKRYQSDQFLRCHAIVL